MRRTSGLYHTTGRTGGTFGGEGCHHCAAEVLLDVKTLKAGNAAVRILCRPRESIGSVAPNKTCKCCRSTVLTAACHWPSSHCIPAQTFVSVSGELNHNCSQWVLNSENGV